MKTLTAMACGLAAVLLFPIMKPGDCLADEAQDHQILISSYFQYVLSQQIPAQAAGLAAEAPEALQPQVSEAAAQWTGTLIERLRLSLQQQFGESARERFQAFVAAYTTAEQSGNITYLRQLARTAGLTSPLPTTYADFHRRVTAGWLKSDVDSGAALLGEIQTWLDVSARNTAAPPLAAWLGRHSKATATEPSQKPSRANSLRNAEAEAGDFNTETTEAPAALDAFAQSRQDRRQRALEEAQAGMQQVASERDAAERDYAARKTAAAQAEAEAVKRHADKLAATETEALEQRKNSWGNKLKGVLSATVGAATGAFTGGLGTEAGTRMADAIFK